MVRRIHLPSLGGGFRALPLLLLISFCRCLPAHDDGTEHTHRVKAPGVDIIDRDDGTRRIKAPFVDIETDGRGGEKVKAPFTHVDTRQPLPAKPKPADVKTPEPKSPDDAKTFPYSHPDGVFSIAVPQGWKQIPAPTNSVTIFEDPSGKAAVKVSLYADRRYEAADLKSVNEKFLEDCRAAFPDVKFLAAQDSDLGGSAAIRTDAVFTRRNVPSRGVMFVAVCGGRAVLFTVRADADDFNAWAPALYAVAGSYRSGKP